MTTDSGISEEAGITRTGAVVHKAALMAGHRVGFMGVLVAAFMAVRRAGLTGRAEALVGEIRLPGRDIVLSPDVVSRVIIVVHIIG